MNKIVDKEGCPVAADIQPIILQQGPDIVLLLHHQHVKHDREPEGQSYGEEGNADKFYGDGNDLSDDCGVNGSRNHLDYGLSIVLQPILEVHIIQ